MNFTDVLPADFLKSFMLASGLLASRDYGKVNRCVLRVVNHARLKSGSYMLRLFLKNSATTMLVVVCLGCAREQVDVDSLIARCAECHTEQGQAAFPGWPAIAGMEKSDIIGKLQGHREGMVPDSTMRQVTFDMTDAEIEAVAEYFSKLEPSQPATSEP